MLTVVVAANGVRLKIEPVTLKKKVTLRAGKKFQLFQIKS